jgi:protein phosphatase
MSTISLEREATHLSVEERTQTGRRRNNQDAPIIAEIVAGYAYLAGVADGMGGYAGGERASATAAKHVHLFADSLKAQFPNTDAEALAFVRSRIPQLFDAIQQEIQDIAIADPGLSQMGTTLVLACVVGRSFFVVNIGDSRAYFLYQDSRGRYTLHQVTQDHTVENDARRAGHRLNLETPEARKMARALTRAVRPGPPFQAEMWPQEGAPANSFMANDGDVLILSSDGMHGSIAHEDIEVILRESRSLDSALERLEVKALENGSTDNITTVGVLFGTRADVEPQSVEPSIAAEASRALLQDAERGDGDTQLVRVPISLAGIPPTTNRVPERKTAVMPTSDTSLAWGNPEPAKKNGPNTTLIILGTMLVVAALITILLMVLGK